MSPVTAIVFKYLGSSSFGMELFLTVWQLTCGR